jgi:carboxymethylenebutenolidase
MSERDVAAPTDAGVVRGRLFLPRGDGPWPLVVFYMDAGGLRPAMSEMARRLAEGGYAVAQPDLYWRFGPYEPFDMGVVFSDPEERSRILEFIRSVHPDQVMADTTLLVDTVGEEDPRIRTRRIGCLGYCMGGRMAFLAAARLADRTVAAAAIHAGELVGEGADSPHRKASEIRGAVYLGVADGDASCTPEHQQALRDALEEAGVRYTLEVFEGARHGFAVPDTPVYAPEAAELHWQRVLGLFGRELPVERS